MTGKAIYATMSDTALCPACGKELEDGDTPYSDFFVVGQHGQVIQSYEDQCGWCDAEYELCKDGENVTAQTI